MIEGVELLVGHAGQTRGQRRKSPAIPPHRERFAGKPHLLHCLFDFLLHALSGQPRQVRGALDDCIPGLWIDREPEARSEANGPERAEAVLVHSIAWVADRADHLSLYVL